MKYILLSVLFCALWAAIGFSAGKNEGEALSRKSVVNLNRQVDMLVEMQNGDYDAYRMSLASQDARIRELQETCAK